MGSKTKLLDAAMRVFIQKGYAATRVEDVCEVAHLTKGSFFHHFATKEDLALQTAQHFSDMADRIFADAPYQRLANKKARVLGYIDQRIALIKGGLTEFTCLLGMFVQETYDTHPAIARAAGRHMQKHAADLARDMPMGLAAFTQSSIQGAFILAKAKNDPKAAIDALGHLRTYLDSQL